MDTNSSPSDSVILLNSIKFHQKNYQQGFTLANTIFLPKNLIIYFFAIIDTHHVLEPCIELWSLQKYTLPSELWCAVVNENESREHRAVSCMGSIHASKLQTHII